MIASAGGCALAAAAAVGAFELAAAAGLATDPGDPAWFGAAFLAAAAFFLVNHLLVSGLIAFEDGEPARDAWRRFLRPMVGADLIGCTILIAFVSLAAGVPGVPLKVVADGVAVIAIALLLALIDRSRRMNEAMSARERAVLEREEAVLAREDATMGTARTPSRWPRPRRAASAAPPSAPTGPSPASTTSPAAPSRCWSRWSTCATGTPLSTRPASAASAACWPRSSAGRPRTWPWPT